MIDEVMVLTLRVEELETTILRVEKTQDAMSLNMGEEDGERKRRKTWFVTFNICQEIYDWNYLFFIYLSYISHLIEYFFFFFLFFPSKNGGFWSPFSLCLFIIFWLMLYNLAFVPKYQVIFLWHVGKTNLTQHMFRVWLYGFEPVLWYVF